MSHDIRTPINGIMGMLNIGDHFPEDMEKQAECREKIRGASSFLFELVNDVLDMSKMESGKIELEEVPFDLLDLLDEVVSMIEVQAMGHGLDFIYERHEEIHRQVIGSPVHLRQILMNIAGNAVKYNRENGSIRLAYQETAFDGANATFEFVCADTGKGMSKEFQEHMFEPFSQEENGARTTFGGSGLGLSIVQKLVEKMNGQISVVSEEGKGSTFTITLTLRVDPLTESDSREPELKTQRKSIKGIRILLAEDNALNMEIAEFILESEGAVITKAWNGQEAVDIFQNSDEGTFDIILMDVMMPVMDGLSATRTIREMDRKDAREIPIIAMTVGDYYNFRRLFYTGYLTGETIRIIFITVLHNTVTEEQMTKPVEGVSEKILACAREEFLEKGYSDASLRTIAAKADVTTGSIYSRFGGKEGLFSAIVQPAADEFTDIFLRTQEEFHAVDEEKQAGLMDAYVTSGMEKMLDCMYDHFEEFQLLLDASYGTKFQNFVEHLVEIETEYTYKFMQVIQFQNEGAKEIPEEFIHIMTTALFESAFEVVRHKMPREKAEDYVKMLEKYHYGGWNAIMNFDENR